jgi:hypothetical protein
MLNLSDSLRGWGLNARSGQSTGIHQRQSITNNNKIDTRALLLNYLGQSQGIESDKADLSHRFGQYRQDNSDILDLIRARANRRHAPIGTVETSFPGITNNKAENNIASAASGLKILGKNLQNANFVELNIDMEGTNKLNVKRDDRGLVLSYHNAQYLIAGQEGSVPTTLKALDAQGQPTGKTLPLDDFGKETLTQLADNGVSREFLKKHICEVQDALPECITLPSRCLPHPPCPTLPPMDWYPPELPPPPVCVPPPPVDCPPPSKPPENCPPGETPPGNPPEKCPPGETPPGKPPEKCPPGETPPPNTGGGKPCPPENPPVKPPKGNDVCPLPPVCVPPIVQVPVEPPKNNSLYLPLISKSPTVPTEPPKNNKPTEKCIPINYNSPIITNNEGKPLYGPPTAEQHLDSILSQVLNRPPTTNIIVPGKEDKPKTSPFLPNGVWAKFN